MFFYWADHCRRGKERENQNLTPEEISTAQKSQVYVLVQKSIPREEQAK